MPKFIHSWQRFFQRATGSLIANPYHLFASFVVMLAAGGLAIFAVASYGLHQHVDGATIGQQRTLAIHAARHLASSPAFERDEPRGARLHANSDLTLLQREIESHMSAFGVERIAFFDRELDPLVAGPVLSLSQTAVDIEALRALASDSSKSYVERLNPDAAVLSYHAPITLADQVVGYVAMQLNTDDAPEIPRTR